jgi:hypothetical protein
MRGKNISVPGMAAATLVCLVATGLTMTDTERFGKLALVLFSSAWLVFYISIAMPFRFKKGSPSEE